MIIYAVNVNSGGGKVLLDRLLVQNPFEPTSAAFLDKRYTPPAEFSGKTFSFSVLSRLLAEKKLHVEIKARSGNESILFFGNLPPFRKPKAKSFLYLQNCYLTGQVPLPKDSMREWMRNLVESWLLKLFYKNVNEIWVQTEWMKEMTQKHCPKAIIKIKPFLPLLPQPMQQLHKKYKFTYVGSLSANKGLSIFLLALKDLEELLKSEIHVCIVLNNNFNESFEVKEFGNSLQKIKLSVRCKIGRHELFKIYESTEYLIVTSIYESFYLPIYEALHFGCKVVVRKDADYIDINIKNQLSYFSINDINLKNFLNSAPHTK